MKVEEIVKHVYRSNDLFEQNNSCPEWMQKFTQDLKDAEKDTAIFPALFRNNSCHFLDTCSLPAPVKGALQILSLIHTL